MSDLNFLIQNLRHQDNLLQSYRTYYFITQSVLLLGGLYLATSFVNFPKLSTGLIFLVASVLALFIHRLLMAAIRHRKIDVGFWQKAILEKELKLSNEQQLYTHFKSAQQERSNPEKVGSDNRLLENAKIQSSRKSIDRLIPLAFFVFWLSLIIAGIASYWFPSLYSICP